MPQQNDLHCALAVLHTHTQTGPGVGPEFLIMIMGVRRGIPDGLHCDLVVLHTHAHGFTPASGDPGAAHAELRCAAMDG